MMFKKHVFCMFLQHLHVWTTDPKWSKHFDVRLGHSLRSQPQGFEQYMKDRGVDVSKDSAQGICLPGRWKGKDLTSLSRKDVEPGLIVFCIGWLKDFRSWVHSVAKWNDSDWFKLNSQSQALVLPASSISNVEILSISKPFQPAYELNSRYSPGCP